MEPATSYVYFIAAFDQRKYKTWQDELAAEKHIDVKIGGTKRTVKTRMKELQTGSVKMLELIAEFIVPGKFDTAETKYQEQFADKHVINEWYSLDKKDIQVISNLSDMYMMIELQNKRITELEKTLKNLQRCDEDLEDPDLYDDLNESEAIDNETATSDATVIPQKSGKYIINDAQGFIRYIKENRPPWYTENKWVSNRALRQIYSEIMQVPISDKKFAAVLKYMGLHVQQKNINKSNTMSALLKPIDSLK